MSSVEADKNKVQSSNIYDEEGKPSYVVGVGASAGGLEALVQFFAAMPVNSGFAFVVVQHLSPDFKSVMDELLSRHTDIPVHLVEGGVAVKADRIYLIPPKAEIVLYGGRLLLTDKDPQTLSLPIDVFFRSLAQDAGNKAIAVVLSGTGSDGSRGIVDVHDAGGLIMVQSEETAKFNGMPRSAVNTGIVDFILAPDQMPKKLLQQTGSPLFADEETESGEGVASLNDHYMEIFKLLRESFRTDFTYYKPTTINRRIERRMAHTKCSTFEDYIRLLDEDSKESRELYQDLLIGVTRFFRDPDAFEVVREEVIPEIIAGKESGDQIRVWVPACSTGEEAYTLAMLFNEAITASSKDIELKMFGTDLDGEAIASAANGVYSQEALRDVDPKLTSKYFRSNGESLQVDATLRKMIVFAEQNLLKDPPFTKIDFVSCRNFLIYLQPVAQKKVFTIFLFSLNVGGALFLGPSESLGDMENEFDAIDRHWNIMRKRREVRISPALNLPSFNSDPRSSDMPSRHGGAKYSGSIRSTVESELYQAYDELLERHIPPSVMVDADAKLVHVFGNAGKYLKGVRGRASLDLLAQVEGNLKIAINTALQRVAKKREPFSLSNIPVEHLSDGRIYVDIHVSPLVDRRYVVVEFSEHRPTSIVRDSGEDFDLNEETRGRIADLEKELQFSRENLQATIEELETSNEELQAANEELLASNEELQSTNEELQSVNEELFTVNTEYEKKNQELTQLNNDIDNLLQSTEIGTIFIDGNLCIRKYTPAIAENFNLLPMDIGRPFEHITVNIVDQVNIVGEVKEVIETREPSVREVRDRNGNWLLMRIYPYAALNQAETGAVLTLVDITSIKDAERKLEENSQLLLAIKDNLEKFAYSVSHDLQGPLRAVSGFLDLLRKRFTDADRETIEYLDHALSGASKMKEMINGLLAYTRIETQAKSFETVSLRDLIAGVLESQKERIEKEGAKVELRQFDLQVFGEREQLTMLFTNIIDNALKFRGSEPAQVVVNGFAEGSTATVTVRDNGIGINPRNLADCTKIFYKDNAEGDYPGLGIGLAICDRIALKHQGRLKIESDSRQGAQVFVTLPQAEAKE